MTWRELSHFVEFLNEELAYAQLQEICVQDRGLALGFWRNGMHWLVLDLLHNTPAALLVKDRNPFGRGPKKPIQLFLNSHAKNKVFESAKWLKSFGRVFVLELLSSDHPEEVCEIEIRLIPRQVNVLVRSAGKSIAWAKPMPMEAQGELTLELPEDRSIESLREEWLAEFHSKITAKPKQDPREKFEAQKLKEIAKKEKAVAELNKKLEVIQENPWRLVGEYIKAQQTLQVPSEWEVYIDRKISLSANIEACFKQAKLSEGKLLGTEQRLRELLLEIEELKNKSFKLTAQAPSQQKNQIKDFKGRKYLLENSCTAYLGKSAQDNLSLLRQARAWDYWLHLRDYPGAHVILRRGKDQKISDDEFREVALWLSRETFAKKSVVSGEKLAVLIAECRHVKPIKGDKLGRVNYHHERVLFVVSE